MEVEPEGENQFEALACQTKQRIADWHFLINWAMVWLIGKTIASGYQRSEVRIESSAKFTLNNVYYQLYWKDENKEKLAGNGPFIKKILPIWIFYAKCLRRKNKHTSSTDHYHRNSSLALLKSWLPWVLIALPKYIIKYIWPKFVILQSYLQFTYSVQVQYNFGSRPVSLPW